MTLAKLSAENRLRRTIANFYDDLNAYVLFAFPWGQPGTQLEEFEGPDIWQRDFGETLRNAINENPFDVVRIATKSAHGVGKSTMTAWLILWAMSTRPHLNAAITANTYPQLNGKTWRELALWHKRAINGHWFKWSAKRFAHVEHPSTWFADAVTNNPQNSEAFAGLHGRYVMTIFDEASGIEDIIWEVCEGAHTTDRSLAFAFGNPSRNAGRFKACFTTDSFRWKNFTVSGMNSMLTNKNLIREWREAYGEDSDFYKVRALGEFPHTTSMQFISEGTLDAAVLRDIPYEAYITMPLIMGVDIARGGDDSGTGGDYGGDNNVITLRRGRKFLESDVFPGRGDTMKVASYIAESIKKHKPWAVFVDEVGLGYGVVDRLRMLGHSVMGVNPGKTPDNESLYKDKRMECWDRMRQWLETADIPENRQLREELLAPQFGHVSLKTRGELLALEKKKHTRNSLGRSPDRADSLAYTFYEEIVGGTEHGDPGDSGYSMYEPEEAWL